jgi:hypothetical protein
MSTIVNHESETLSGSLYLTNEEVAEKLSGVIRRFLDDKTQKKSLIFEIIAEELSYSELLFCTGQFILGRLEEAEEMQMTSKMKKLKSLLDKLSSSSDESEEKED